MSERKGEYNPFLEDNAEKQKVVFVDTGDAIKHEARDAADIRMTEDKQEGKWYNPRAIAKRVWKHNLFVDYYRGKEISKARQKIVDEKNIYANEGDADKNHHNNAMEALVERFSSEYEGQIDAHSKESKEILEDNEKTRALKDGIKAVIQSYARGEITDLQQFDEEKNRLFSEAVGLTKEIAMPSEIYANNLFKIAEQVKQAVSHGKALEQIDLDFDIVVGRAKMGVKTEANFSRVDKIVDKISGSKVGKFINESTLASAVAITYGAGAAISQRVARSKIVAWGTFGASALVSGGITAARESRQIEEERKQHARERAKGKVFQPEQSRRAEMESSRIGTVNAEDMRIALENMAYDRGTNGELIERQLSPEDYNDAMQALAQIEARRSVSSQQSLDLISYSDAKQVEQERAALYISVARAKAHIRKQSPNPDQFDEEFGSMQEHSIQELIKGEQGIEAKNRMFKKLKHRKVAKAFAKGVATGLVIGTVGQEVHALFDEHQHGLVESALGKDSFKHGDHLTWMKALKDYMSGDLPKGDLIAAQEIHNGAVNAHIPEGFSLNFTDAQHASFVEPNGTNHDVVFEQSGIISEQSRQLLAQDGIRVDDNHFLTTTASMKGVFGNATDGQQVSTKEFVQNHQDSFTKVHRQMWFDNDTKQFDKNELKLQWGGEHGTGVDAHGNYAYNVKHMLGGGSHHGKMSADAQKLMHEGKLKLLLSLSKDTQTTPIEVPIDAEGNITIDPQSDVGKMLFHVEHGKAVFEGKYAEVAQMIESKNGVEQVRILATQTGEGIKHIDSFHAEAYALENPESTGAIINESLFNVPVDYVIDPPILVPLLGRKPLENWYGLHGTDIPDGPDEHKDKKVTDITPAFNLYGYMGQYEDSYQKSEALEHNPDAILDPKIESEKYFESLEADYLGEIENAAMEIGPMNPSCKVSICIPVAGHQEGENIYQSLLNYTDQTGSKDDFEIVLFVNIPEKDKQENPVVPDNTAAEIERFRKDYPDMPIKVFSRTLPIENANIAYVRKLLNDAVLMRSENREGDHDDLIMISNDADNNGVVPTYVDNFIKKFKDNPEFDAMLGNIDWDPDSYQRKPMLHVGVRLFQYIYNQARTNGDHMQSSGGNFAFRSSIYAAVKGYPENITEDQAGEDNIFGSRIKDARRKAKTRKGIGYAGSGASRIYTSSRRAEDALEKGLAPIEMWNGVFSAFDDDVRKVDWEQFNDGIDFHNEEQVQELVTQLERIINRTINEVMAPARKYDDTWQAQRGSEYIKRSLGWLGLEYDSLADGSIKITNASKLIEGLQSYQAEGEKLRDRKLKKPYFRQRNTKENETLENEAVDTEVSKRRMSVKETVTLEPLAEIKNTHPEKDHTTKRLERGAIFNQARKEKGLTTSEQENVWFNLMRDNDKGYLNKAIGEDMLSSEQVQSIKNILNDKEVSFGQTGDDVNKYSSRAEQLKEIFKILIPVYESLAQSNDIATRSNLDKLGTIGNVIIGLNKGLSRQAENLAIHELGLERNGKKLKWLKRKNKK